MNRGGESRERCINASRRTRERNREKKGTRERGRNVRLVDDRTIVSAEKGCNGGKERGEKKNTGTKSAPGVQDWLCEMRIGCKRSPRDFVVEDISRVHESWA